MSVATTNTVSIFTYFHVLQGREKKNVVVSLDFPSVFFSVLLLIHEGKDERERTQTCSTHVVMKFTKIANFFDTPATPEGSVICFAFTLFSLLSLSLS